VESKKSEDTRVVASASSPTPPSSSHPADDDANAARVIATSPSIVDAGAVSRASSCRLVFGPAEQPFRGPAAIVMTPRELSLVANDHGKPRIFPVAVTRPPAASAPRVTVRQPSSFVSMRSTPCEIAGSYAYCPENDGTVYRTSIGTDDTKAVAKGRPGARIAVASLGDGHAVVATLDTRRTSEGEVLQAFVTLDDGKTQRLSEEGAGAIAVRMVPRGRGAVAVYLDARTAMVPVHARPLALENGELSLGSDAVVFVGGPPELGIDVTLAATARSLHALVPLGRGARDFGMVAIDVRDPPKEDSVWSLYPNGLDPAAIGATTNNADGAWVSRVRPVDASAHSPRVLELGRIDDTGVFTSMGIIADGGHVTDIAMATDAFGAVWILYGDSSITWLERRICS